MLIQEFLNYLVLEKRYSHHTVKSYKTDILQFLDFINHLENAPDLSGVSLKILRTWVQSLPEDMANKSIARKISAIKTYFKYLHKNNKILMNQALLLKTPRLEKDLPVFVNKEILNKELDNFPTGDNFENSRDRLILELLYATGIRLDELVTLETNKVDLSLKTIIVQGKRNKQRQIPITNRILIHFKNYEKYRKTLEIQHVNVYFLTKKGEPIYAKLVYRVVKKFLENITGDSTMSTHTMRHTFATHMLNNGADIYAIKELLGHSNLNATQVYTHTTYEHLLKVYKQAHPRA